MSALQQALADYLRLRRSLGHELAEAARLLPGFIAYLEERGAQTITIQTALAWAQQANTTADGRMTTVGPRRMTAIRGCPCRPWASDQGEPPNWSEPSTAGAVRATSCRSTAVSPTGSRLIRPSAYSKMPQAVRPGSCRRPRTTSPTLTTWSSRWAGGAS